MAELDVTGLLSVHRAIEIIDAVAVAPRVERVPLASALGRRLAQALVADRDYPPFDKSLMDGYAVRGEDVRALPATLRVVGEVAAGQSPSHPVNSGETVAIMTGAPMPAGAEGVVPVEDVEQINPEGGPAVRILRAD